jgi:two-component system CheB/CheR fusion protein
VIFGRNDLVQDAPISRIDLLTCRNTLMYFNAEQQARIVQRLHFALNRTGVLLLGKAETLWSHGALFQAVDAKRRFFRKVPPQVHDERALGLGAGLPPRGWEDGEPARLRDEALLTSPVAHVVVDRQGVLVSANHRADAVFGVGRRDLGRPFQDLELSYRPVELRSHIEEALAERRQVVLRDVEWARGPGERVYLELQVIPLLEPEGGEAAGVSVFITEVTRFRQLQGELEYANRQLETAYEELHSTNEELETTNEELQSTVEELETTNEELQSTNEELETMNEELQSMNDELHLTNEELRRRTLEVGDVNAFMESVLAGLRAAVVVVDREQRVLAWNRQAEELWGVRREEVLGRHLLGLDVGLPLERLTPMLREILARTPDRPVHDGAAPRASGDGAVSELRLPALTRRGRTIEVRVTATPLRREGKAVAGAILVVDEDLAAP